MPSTIHIPSRVTTAHCTYPADYRLTVLRLSTAHLHPSRLAHHALCAQQSYYFCKQGVLRVLVSQLLTRLGIEASASPHAHRLTHIVAGDVHDTKSTKIVVARRCVTSPACVGAHPTRPPTSTKPDVAVVNTLWAVDCAIYGRVMDAGALLVLLTCCVFPHHQTLVIIPCRCSFKYSLSCKTLLSSFSTPFSSFSSPPHRRLHARQPPLPTTPHPARAAHVHSTGPSVRHHPGL